MNFLDTNIWVELLVTKTPQQPHEIRQAQLASNLITDLQKNKEIIVTCKEQMLELINSIQKVKRREYNRIYKANGKNGIGSVKELRKIAEFTDVISICRMAITDLKNMAKVENTIEQPIECVIEKIFKNLKFVDITDSIFLDFCIEKKIKFYTFDKEIKDLFPNNELIILLQ